MIEPTAFRSFPLLGNPHVQTILGSLGSQAGPAGEEIVVELPDGDRLVVVANTPPEWTPTDPSVAMVHGLCGSASSPYLVRLATKLAGRNVRSLRINLRGCGEGAGLARNLYHSGRSEDIAAVVDHLLATHPDSPLTLVGFSLGGNIALKYASELEQASRIERVLAVCPPVDLLACSRRFSRRENRIYERHFVQLLREAVTERLGTFPDLEPIEFPWQMSLFDFDDLFTAPRSGFDGAEDYYRRCSSGPLLPRIDIPAAVLFADDDPLIDSSGVRPEELPPALRIDRSPRGGHMGFLGSDPPSGPRCDGPQAGHLGHGPHRPSRRQAGPGF